MRPDSIATEPSTGPEREIHDLDRVSLSGRAVDAPTPIQDQQRTPIRVDKTVHSRSRRFHTSLVTLTGLVPLQLIGDAPGHGEHSGVAGGQQHVWGDRRRVPGRRDDDLGARSDRSAQIWSDLEAEAGCL